jgi:hypothetical protein
MSSIWRETTDGWTAVAPAGFPDEKTLQTLVETTPQLLPLSGAPTLAVVGREVLLGTGYADVLAVETSGRPVVIEVKLARNAEARLRPEQAGLATVWNRNGQAFLSLWRTVFERRAPDSIEPVEAELGQVPLGKGNVITDVTDNLLRLLTTAYREATGQRPADTA